MASHTPPDKLEDGLFEIVNQLNRGSHLITSLAERERIAAFNLIAGRHAKMSTAYTSALTYLHAGRGLLTDETWQHNYDLVFSIEYLLAECELLTTAMAAAKNRLAMLAERAKSAHDIALVTRLRLTLDAALDDLAGSNIDGHPGLWGSGSRGGLHACAAVVPAGRGNPTALPGPARVVAISYPAHGVADRTRTRGATPACRPEWPGRRPPAGSSPGAGRAQFFLGEFPAAHVHFAQELAHYDPQQHRAHTFLYGMEPGVAYLSFAAWTLWCMGYPDQALQRIQAALSLTQTLSHPASRALALIFAAYLHQHRGKRSG